MAVYLNSTPQEDGNALTGGAVSIGNVPGVFFVSDANVVRFREETKAGHEAYLELTSGGQFVGVWDSFGTYLESGDTGFTFRWKFWARGTGTVALTQDTDPSWDVSALPAASIGNLVVSAVNWTLYEVDADPIVLADFLSFDGIRLGLDLTSGAVDFTTIQLECVPISGATGWWVNQSGYDTGPFTATAKDSRALDGVTHDDTSDPGTTLQDAVDQTLALDILNYPGTDATLGPLITTGTNSFARVEEDLFTPGGYVATTSMGASYVSVNVGGGPATPVGTEGVDYIRIPGFVIYDGAYAYTRLASNRDEVALPDTVWTTPHIFYNRDLGTWQNGDYESLNLKVLVYISDEYQNPSTTTGGFVPPVGATLLYSITPDQATDDVIDPITLPSDGSFTIWTVAGTLRDEPGDQINIDDFNAEPGVHFSGTVVVQSDDERDPLEANPLNYDLSYPPYSVWNPDASPPLASWVRNIQRNDGLGISQWRWRSYVTVNVRVVGVTFDDGSSSIRWRAIR